MAEPCRAIHQSLADEASAPYRAANIVAWALSKASTSLVRDFADSVYEDRVEAQGRPGFVALRDVKADEYCASTSSPCYSRQLHSGKVQAKCKDRAHGRCG